MKKLLIASAALAMVAGSVQAQSSVTVYGTVDIGYAASENITTTTAGVATRVKQTNTGNGDGNLSTSVFGVRGAEDLGGGTKANFQLEWDLVDAGMGGNGNTSISKTAADTTTSISRGANADQAAGFGARYSWVGLEDAKMGQLRLGRQAQSIHSVVAGGSAGGANNVAGAIYSAGMNASPNDASIRPQLVFVNRAITYISPTFNGFTVEAQTAKQNIDNGGVVSYAKETGGSLKYAAGKLAVAYGLADSRTDTTSATTATDDVKKQYALSATYDFGVAKLFALNTKRKDTMAGALVADTQATEVGVQVPQGKTVFFASLFDGDRKGNTQSAIATANADVAGYQVGALYNLSKRTTAYAIYGNQDITAKDNASKVETTTTAVGIRHSF